MSVGASSNTRLEAAGVWLGVRGSARPSTLLQRQKLTESTSCELTCEQRRSLSLLDINPSQYRKELSFQTVRFARSTSSLAAMHQWSKFPQDFTILAWFSSSAKVLARSSRQYLLRRGAEIIGNGSEELPSSQSIDITSDVLGRAQSPKPTQAWPSCGLQSGLGWACME